MLPGDRWTPIPATTVEGGYIVAIRDSETGEVRFASFDDTWDESTEYGWCEGNDACDGNRHQRFARAIGQEPPDGYHAKCSVGRFDVFVRSKLTGDELYKDGEWPDEPPREMGTSTTRSTAEDN